MSGPRLFASLPITVVNALPVFLIHRSIVQGVRLARVKQLSADAYS